MECEGWLPLIVLIGNEGFRNFQRMSEMRIIARLLFLLSSSRKLLRGVELALRSKYEGGYSG